MINYPPIPTLYVMYVDIMSDKFVDGVLRQAPLFKYRLKRPRKGRCVPKGARRSSTKIACSIRRICSDRYLLRKYSQKELN